MEGSTKCDMEKQNIQKEPFVHTEVNTAIEASYDTLATPTENEGELSINLLANGIYCAACIQKIESTIRKEKNVTYVRLNFSTKKLLIKWTGKPEEANNFVKKIENLGYQPAPYNLETQQSEVRKQERFLLLCLGVSGFAMGNIMLLSVSLWMTDAETMGPAMRDFLHWVSAIIAIPTLLYAGRPFYRSAFSVLHKGHTNMDVPITVALFLASSISLYEVINSAEHVYFDSSVMLLFFLLIGRYLDFRAKKHATSTATELLSSLTGFANVIIDNDIKRMPISELKENMIILLSAGEKLPVDGVILEGESEIDTSLVTGETLPQNVKKDDFVYAGTLNIAAPIKITVRKEAKQTLLSDIIDLTEKAQQYQSHYTRIADKTASYYTPIVHLIAIAAFLYWSLYVHVSWQDALMISVTVLIITCPCALGLAVPVVQVLTTSKLLKNGIILKSGDALEKLASITTVIFDKTGTLTKGQLELIGVYNDQDIQLSAALASNSNHPLCKSLGKYAQNHFSIQQNQYKIRDISEVKEVKGQGIEAKYKNCTIKIGNRRYCGDKNAPKTPNTELWLQDEYGKRTPLYFEDKIKDDAYETVQKFQKKCKNVALLSGDTKTVTAKVAKALNIEEHRGEQLPTEKYNFIKNLKENGEKVLMVGDGLNDTPSLALADASIAPGTALELAQRHSDIVYMSNKTSPIYDTYIASKTSLSLIKQNIALAIIYNVIAIPIAFMGYATPLIAAIAMSGSSIIVICNSYRVNFKL
ncbi:MAG: hypothetical protein CBB87_06190 [Micavibrio sp. TMED27]|nr:heavy metal translocating P-type ATPase [Micavibrio sp.]OUT91600.1 MAG: hypothetical protein CBB87_06190 [Micavibrio sp. TMED27]